jgi:DegV family protein with EDD domain
VDLPAELLETRNIRWTGFHVTLGDREYRDDLGDTVPHPDFYRAMTEGADTKTAQINVDEYMTYFAALLQEGKDVVHVVLSSGLSGSYNSARVAAEEYMPMHPGRRVHVVDTLSAGPELRLVVEKLQELILEGRSFDEIVEEIEKYHKRSFLIFSLQSLHNFVANGRVSPALGALVGLLGIRVVGRASEQGTLEPLSKVRGDKKALSEIVRIMKELGWKGGRVRIAHNENATMAETLREALRALYSKLDVTIDRCRGLCSYYAEKGGLLVGFEGV